MQHQCIECSETSVVVVPPALSGNVDAVPRQWMQYVVTEDAVSKKMDAVILQ